MHKASTSAGRHVTGPSYLYEKAKANAKEPELPKRDRPPNELGRYKIGCHGVAHNLHQWKNCEGARRPHKYVFCVRNLIQIQRLGVLQADLALDRSCDSLREEVCYFGILGIRRGVCGARPLIIRGLGGLGRRAAASPEERQSGSGTQYPAVRWNISCRCRFGLVFV